jgi:hypothetical protein
MENLKSRKKTKKGGETPKNKESTKSTDVGASLSSVESIASDRARGRPSDDSDGGARSSSSASEIQRSREASVERSNDVGDDGQADGFYNPGKYMPSSCLSDAEGEEIYGYRYNLLVPPGCRPPPAQAPVEMCCPGVYGQE